MEEITDDNGSRDGADNVMQTIQGVDRDGIQPDKEIEPCPQCRHAKFINEECRNCLRLADAMKYQIRVKNKVKMAYYKKRHGGWGSGICGNVNCKVHKKGIYAP